MEHARALQQQAQCNAANTTYLMQQLCFYDTAGAGDGRELVVMLQMYCTPTPMRRSSAQLVVCGFWTVL
jgi:hypothetical protein